MNIADVDRILDGAKAKLIGRAVFRIRSESSTGEPHREGIDM